MTSPVVVEVVGDSHGAGTRSGDRPRKAEQPRHSAQFPHPVRLLSPSLLTMAEQTRTVLLRGGEWDGHTVSGVATNTRDLDYMGKRYVRTGEVAPRPGAPGEVGFGGVRVVHQLPVYAAES